MLLTENATTEELLNILAGNRRKYKCYEILEALIENNLEFKQKIIEGVNSENILAFDEELWSKIHDHKLPGSHAGEQPIDNLEEIFQYGFNIGNCSRTASQLSKSLFPSDVCGGIIPILSGTQNCQYGDHTWISFLIDDEEYICDTSLMIIMTAEFAQKNFGYNATSRIGIDIIGNKKK